MSGANLRPLLPAPRESGSTTTDASAESAASRRQNSGACDRCRSHKSRCDRSRPKCSHCAKRQVHCFYSADIKKQSFEVLKRQGELLHMMRTAPEGEALDILFRLRASGDAQSVLESFRSSMGRQYQPSAIQAVRAVSPQTLSVLEFKMSTRQTVPYPASIHAQQDGSQPATSARGSLGTRRCKILEARHSTIRAEEGAGRRDREVKQPLRVDLWFPTVITRTSGGEKALCMASGRYVYYG
ncbi:hypothetical protein Micbo1qcDRAFT_70142 [Microdochium bolleyi]|uniref:Zn(2)-C6 fungal-type domain-containing protein n=1 Tax=Microdochium bolleyi TaxID=196109 RepID=A0A136IIM1_9PEZI|nr:hypothetical protein Micbo1qcDRAFT_70142 [Microdochium bolleyi]